MTLGLLFFSACAFLIMTDYIQDIPYVVYIIVF